MECKKCGAELPYNAFGDIRCQFCNAQNHVPLPNIVSEPKKEPVKEEVQIPVEEIKVEPKVETLNPEIQEKPSQPVIEKETSEKGVPKGPFILAVVTFVIYVGLWVVARFFGVYSVILLDYSWYLFILSFLLLIYLLIKTPRKGVPKGPFILAVVTFVIHLGVWVSERFISINSGIFFDISWYLFILSFLLFYLSVGKGEVKQG